MSQQRFRMKSNAKQIENVSICCDFVERIVRLVAFDNVASTLSTVLLHYCCWCGWGLMLHNFRCLRLADNSVNGYPSVRPSVRLSVCLSGDSKKLHGKRPACQWRVYNVSRQQQRTRGVTQQGKPSVACVGSQRQCCGLSEDRQTLLSDADHWCDHPENNEDNTRKK